MSGIRSVIGFAGIAGVLVPLAVIWLPELRHDRVAIPSIPPASVQATLARLDRDVCPVFGKHDLSLLADASEGDIDAAIGNIKRAQLALPGHQAISFHPSFSAADLAAGDGGTQLLSASLGIPNLMVLAWERTGDPTYLRRARDYIRGWWQYEQNAWLPRALQWNDHAVAARVFSLTHYLCAIRRLPDVGAE